MTSAMSSHFFVPQYVQSCVYLSYFSDIILYSDIDENKIKVAQQDKQYILNKMADMSYRTFSN